MHKPAHKKSAPKTSLASPLDTLPLPAEQPRGFWHEALNTAVLFIIAISVALGLKAYVIQPYVVDGESMQSTLQDHDRLLVDKLPVTIGHWRHHPYAPKRGDIIIFNQSGLPGLAGTKQLIKRVVGLPGDKVAVAKGHITITNTAHPRGFNPDTSGTYRISQSTPGDVSLTLGPEQFFVCGDNRGNSEDSRAFGPVSSSQIVGKLSYRIFPLGKIQHY